MTISTTTGHNAPSSGQSNQLRAGALGTGTIVFLVTSAAAPMAAIAGSGSLAILLGNGAGVPGAYLIACVILLLFSVGYTAMAQHVRKAGGFYAFTERGLGRTAGGASAFVALFGYNAMLMGIYGLFGAAADLLFNGAFGIVLPWWVYSGLAWVLVAWLGYRQIDLSAKVLTVLVLLEYAIVLILDFAIGSAGGPEGGLTLAPFAPANVFGGSIIIALLFVFGAFVGFEATTIYSEEARDPGRTIPRATYISVILIGLFYALTSYGMVIGGGPTKVVDAVGGLQDPTSFLFVLGETYLGTGFTLLMRVLFVTSVFASLVAFHNSAARYFFVLGRDGLLPASLGTAHEAHGSPHVGSVTQTIATAIVVVAFALAGQDPILALFSWLTGVGTLAIIGVMAAASFAVLVFFQSEKPAGASTLSLTLAPIAAGIILTILFVFTVLRFDVLTGPLNIMTIILPLLIPVFALAGAVMGRQSR
jgi:amino acid transporter